MEVPSDRAEQQILVTKLITGNATQEERDKALATVMLSLWGQQELRDLIRLVHKEECDKCPFKEASTHGCRAGEDSTWQKVTMILLKYGGWALLIIAGLLKISVK